MQGACGCAAGSLGGAGGEDGPEHCSCPGSCGAVTQGLAGDAAWPHVPGHPVSHTGPMSLALRTSLAAFLCTKVPRHRRMWLILTGIFGLCISSVCAKRDGTCGPKPRFCGVFSLSGLGATSGAGGRLGKRLLILFCLLSCWEAEGQRKISAGSM